METTHNRIRSSFAALLVPVIIGATIALSFVPSAAFADGKSSPGSWGTSAPVTVSTPVTYYTSNLNPVIKTKPIYSTPTNNYLSASRSSYLNLNFDFTRNNIDQSVSNTINNNVNVNGNNNNVGINNSQETNQNAGITNSRNAAQRSSYYDYFANFRRSNSSTNGSGTANNSGQNNNTNQSNVFNSNTSSHDHDHDTDTHTHAKQPSCELDASDTRVDEGDRVTLEWDTENAERATINHGIGSVDEDGGSERVTVDEDTTFRMTVENKDGDEDTCSVTVRVDENDNNNDFSGIVIDDEPTQNPYSNVYLSDIPYTGLDLGEYAWAYWAAFAGLIAAGAYLVFFMGVPFVLRRATAIGEEVETELTEEENNGVQKSAMTLPAAVTSYGTAKIVAQSDITEFVNALIEADNDTASDILENATKNGASASVFLNRASALLRSGAIAVEQSVSETLISSLETAAKARA